MAEVAFLLSRLPLGHPFPDTTFNVGLLSAGTARNTIPGVACLSGEIRSFNPTRIDQLQNLIKSRLPTSARYSASMENPGYTIPAVSPALAEAKAALKYLGILPRLVSTYACFDANIFIAHGIEIINLSDGSSHNHTTRESITLKNLNLLSRITYALAVGSLTSS